MIKFFVVAALHFLPAGDDFAHMSVARYASAPL